MADRLPTSARALFIDLCWNTTFIVVNVVVLVLCYPQDPAPNPSDSFSVPTTQAAPSSSLAVLLTANSASSNLTTVTTSNSGVGLGTTDQGPLTLVPQYNSSQHGFCEHTIVTYLIGQIALAVLYSLPQKPLQYYLDNHQPQWKRHPVVLALWTIWSLTTLFDVAWFITGQVWLFKSQTCRLTNPQLYFLSLAEIVFFYVTTVLPLLSYIILIMIARRRRLMNGGLGFGGGGRLPGGALGGPAAHLRGGLSKGELNSLKTFLFKPGLASRAEEMVTIEEDENEEVENFDGHRSEEGLGDDGGARHSDEGEEVELEEGVNGSDAIKLKTFSLSGAAPVDEIGGAESPIQVVVTVDGNTSAVSESGVGIGSNEAEGNGAFGQRSSDTAKVESDELDPWVVVSLADDETVHQLQKQSDQTAAPVRITINGEPAASVSAGSEGTPSLSSSSSSSTSSSAPSKSSFGSRKKNRKVSQSPAAGVVPVTDPGTTSSNSSLSPLSAANLPMGASSSSSTTTQPSATSPAASTRRGRQSSKVKTTTNSEDSSADPSQPLPVQEPPVETSLPPNSSTNCAICFNDFSENDLIRVLACKHIFHAECIDPWLIVPESTVAGTPSETATTMAHRTCPLCVREAILPEFRDPEVVQAMKQAQEEEEYMERILARSRAEAELSMRRREAREARRRSRSSGTGSVLFRSMRRSRSEGGEGASAAAAAAGGSGTPASSTGRGRFFRRRSDNPQSLSPAGGDSRPVSIVPVAATPDGAATVDAGAVSAVEAVSESS